MRIQTSMESLSSLLTDTRILPAAADASLHDSSDGESTDASTISDYQSAQFDPFNDKDDNPRRRIHTDIANASDKSTLAELEMVPLASPNKTATVTSLLLNSQQTRDTVPVTVCARNLSYRVQTTSHSTRVKKMFGYSQQVSVRSEKKILDSISLAIHPGEILAIMGPSGSGKSSLLNTLSGRVRKGVIVDDGGILYNGVPVNKGMNGKVFGYVLQHDAVQQNLTVRETLDYSLQLRYGGVYTKKQRHIRVQEVIEELGLSRCADSLVGGHISRGISGGELKRVAIGVELLSQPSVLYLDECTSGLDSKAALNLVETLVALAHHGRTIVCTIHQPQSSIFKMFDKILLLAQGRAMYMGPADGAVEYFEKLGHVCPSYSNPSDFFLDTLSVDTRGCDVEQESSKRIDELALAYSESTQCLKNEQEAAEWVCEAQKPFDFTRFLASSSTTWLWTTLVIFRRNFKESCRNNIVTMSRMMQTVVLGLFIGFLYWDMGLGQDSIRNRRGALFCLAIQQGLCGFLSILTAFQSEKLVYFREHDAGLYSTSSYFFARLLVELPLTIISPILFTAIAYPLLHLQSSMVLFSEACAAIMVSTVAAQALGIVVGTVTPSHEVANVVAPVFLGFITIFGGLLIDKNSVPAVLAWIPQLNFVAYNYESEFLLDESLLTKF